jgi:hypothetical protein
MVLPLDWKVGPRTPLAEPPKGTPEPGREDGNEGRERDISKKFQGLLAICVILNFKENEAFSVHAQECNSKWPTGSRVRAALPHGMMSAARSVRNEHTMACAGVGHRHKVAGSRNA